ncbi:sensor domain-containing diguanylate cyclase [Pseudomonas sp. GD03860]|uniref:sensor domain-containing diguanylate cyclase n=1 Tax=Pseudomonas TaxID=286 RepID=UPI00236476F1|nr:MULTISPECIES: sensor domain-containing diguanylate cyclase [Pseudomonas]MDD2056698.1 sensor domain-containing diguanylate cyclase [Pseudomonas putida]MDH0638108.1 sensor domain-containing diguanylate cyclase [Pseudomonas sp. GD03860]
MKYLRPSSISLRGLILTFVLLAVMATLCNSLWVAYGVQRDALVHSRLEANRAYASKVASSIGQFLSSAHQHLGYSSQRVAEDFGNPQLLRDEAVRLHGQDTDFNAVRIIDASGKVVQAYPDQAHITGTTLKSEEIQQALKERRPLVSHAYVTVAGNLIVFISNPIFSAKGQFLGVIGASVFIRQQGVLHTLIGNHYHHDGTYAFVADENRRLLYHSDHARIGEVLTSSPTVDAALRGENGAMDVPNYKGIQMLAGYAQVTNANWAVVAQQPRDLALAPLNKLMRDMLIKIVPAGLVGLVLILLGTMLITRPLRQLAKSATHLSDPAATEDLRGINAWYEEVAAIRRALFNSVQLVQQQIGSLSHAAQSDALTGLANRRAMDAALQALDQSGRHYAVLALDIDHFKRVNDSFGHDAGDVALKQVAGIIRQCSRDQDLGCRAGGEEFVLVLPEASLEAARDIAERIRQTLASTEIAQVGTLTISIGVACRSADTPTPEAILKHADQRLYRAKAGGRNCVVADDAQAQAV